MAGLTAYVSGIINFPDLFCESISKVRHDFCEHYSHSESHHIIWLLIIWCYCVVDETKLWNQCIDLSQVPLHVTADLVRLDRICMTRDKSQKHCIGFVSLGLWLRQKWMKFSTDDIFNLIFLSWRVSLWLKGIFRGGLISLCKYPTWHGICNILEISYEITCECWSTWLMIN